VETSTYGLTGIYGSELVASRVVTELTVEISSMLRLLDVDLKGPALMLGDNMLMFLNTALC